MCSFCPDAHYDSDYSETVRTLMPMSQPPPCPFRSRASWKHQERVSQKALRRRTEALFFAVPGLGGERGATSPEPTVTGVCDRQFADRDRA